MILELRDKFLVMGIHESQFFQMDLAEVERYAAAYQERQIIRRREIASYIHSTGRLIGIGVGAVQSSKIHYPSLYEAFPSLFEDENEQETMQQSVVNFMNFANAHNQKIRNKAIDGRKIKNKDYR